MNWAFFPSPKSPSFCSLRAKTPATLFPFHSAYSLGEGGAAPRLSSRHKIHKNDASHCFVVGLALALRWLDRLSDVVGLSCVSHAGSVGGSACVLPGFHLIQKAGVECPNIHAHKYVFIEMLDRV